MIPALPIAGSHNPNDLVDWLWVAVWAVVAGVVIAILVAVAVAVRARRRRLEGTRDGS